MTKKEQDKVIKDQLDYKEQIDNFIKKVLIKDVDWGRFHKATDCQYIKTPEKCKDNTHWSKSRLNKSGSEKFLDYFQKRAVFFMDGETWEMSGKQAGVYCYVCHLNDQEGMNSGEGRGACDVREVEGSHNKAIKMAQIRAQIDAVLRYGSLSDSFTQDIEEEDFIIHDPSAKVSPVQLTKIKSLLERKGKTVEELIGQIPHGDLEALTAVEATSVIINLMNLPNVK